MGGNQHHNKTFVSRFFFEQYVHSAGFPVRQLTFVSDLGGGNPAGDQPMDPHGRNRLHSSTRPTARKSLDAFSLEGFLVDLFFRAFRVEERRSTDS